MRAMILLIFLTRLFDYVGWLSSKTEVNRSRHLDTKDMNLLKHEIV